ncbi:MAG: Uma2 family endonuclease [Acidobacteriaceae bacterium]|nr:Uma2 family endonuclease [Acidobacteriaceae bacterium]
MATSTLVPVSEYLATSYRPDVDYVDGEIQERNLGEWPHSRAQALVLAFLLQRERQWGIRAVPEQRVQVSPTRFRIPDVCVILSSDPITPILKQPPFLCIEILSREDTVSRLNERLADYFRFGVRYVWVIDPLARRAFVYTPGHMQEVLDGSLCTQNPELLVPLAEILKND